MLFIGNVDIGNCSFIPFKTPLDSKFDDQIPPAQRFTVSMLLDSLQNNVKYFSFNDCYF